MTIPVAILEVGIIYSFIANMQHITLKIDYPKPLLAVTGKIYNLERFSNKYL
jgi:hypothetical protein